MSKYFFYTPNHATHPLAFILNQRHHNRLPAVMHHLTAGSKPYRHKLLNYSIYTTQAVPVPAELNQMIDYVWERVYGLPKR